MTTKGNLIYHFAAVSLDVPLKYKFPAIRVETCVTSDVITTDMFAEPVLCFLDIIHTVGPIGRQPDLLKACYLGSLNRMMDLGQRSIVSTC